MGVSSRRSLGTLVVGREAIVVVLGDVIGQHAQAMAKNGDGFSLARRAVAIPGVALLANTQKKDQSWWR